MKWLALIPIVIALWFFWPKTREPSPNSSEPTASTRTKLDSAWRAKPEREMTIAEMEQWAASPSDEMLWKELQKSSEEYLAANKDRKWFDPPRLSVFLSRELGRRHGEEGVLELLDCRWMTREDFELEEILEGSPQTTLTSNLIYAALGGWLDSHPEKGLARVIEIHGVSDSSTNTENPISYFTGIHLIPGAEMVAISEIWAYERILRNSFTVLSQSNPTKAVELLFEGSRGMVFRAPYVLGALMTGCDRDLMMQLADRLHGLEENNQEVVRFPSSEVINILIEEHDRMANIDDPDHLIFKSEFPWIFARHRPDLAESLMQRESNPQLLNISLLAALANEDAKHLELFEHLPPDDRDFFTSVANEIKPSMRYGPIDGKEGGVFPDWDNYHETFMDVVRESDLPDEEKVRHLETLQKSWDRAKE